MPYDDDDYVDYENEDYDDSEFVEDNLNDEDYALLYETLPVLKDQLGDYNSDIQDEDLKAVLYYNYFEVDNALAEIRSKFKRKRETTPPPPPATSDKKLSKLQILARQRTQKNAVSTSSITSSITSSTEATKRSFGLEGVLKRGSASGASGATGIGSATKLSSLTSGSTRSGLASLRGKSSRSSKLDFLIASRKHVVHTSSKPGSLTDSEAVSTAVPVPVSVSVQLSKLAQKSDHSQDVKLPELEVNSETYFRITSIAKTFLTKIMINDNLGSKRRKLEESSSIFNVFPETNYEIAEKAKSNFSKPSPDDIVLKAQETNSQEIAVGVKALKLDSKKPAVTKPKKKIDVSKELGVKLSKPSLSFGVIGHVDSGKSTLAGRLLYDLKIVDSKTLHKLTKESESIGKASFALAWIMDQTKDERERGVTVDICQTQFKTEKSLFTMIDCPGHKSFIPQMINGISQADLTLLIVDAGKNAFESSFGLSGQTREQITIARNLGLDRLVVAVNKMDTADWQQDRFEQIVDELTQFLVDDLAFAKEKIRFVPISGLSGGNVVAKQKLSWYSKGTLMEVLEAEAELKHSEDSADRFNDEFIMSINDIETSSDDVLISGRVNSGKIQPGESIAVSPSGDVGVVDKIFANIESPGAPKAKQDRDLVIVGEFVTLKVKNLSLPDNVKVGDLVSRSNSPIQASMKIKCKITTFKMNLPLLLGSQFILFRNNISVPATLSNIEGRKKKHLGSNQDALVEIDLVERPIPVLTYAQDSKLGRVVLRKNGETIGAGTVEEVL